MSSSPIDPNDFTNKIDNPFMILRPGTTFVYADKGENSTDTITVTGKTEMVDGVECVVVRDTAYLNGLLVEDTFDFFAQDKDGNVWYFGEDTHQYDPGNPVPVGSAGSWRAGVDGAEPGIIMEANPQVGDTYRQENAPGVAEDTAKVVALDQTLNVIYGNSGGVLKTREFSPLSPGDIEHKYYMPGVGEVLTATADGEFEQLVSITVRGHGGDDRLLGYAGGDVMWGGAGDDVLRGFAGNDSMHGGSGGDSLIGGAGGDHLSGGCGDDMLTGRRGSDTFSFAGLHNGSADTDTIADYHRGQTDVIDLPGGVSSVAHEALVGGTWELTLMGDGDVIRLPGVTDSNNDGHIVDNLLFA